MREGDGSIVSRRADTGDQLSLQRRTEDGADLSVLGLGVKESGPLRLGRTPVTAHQSLR